MFVATTDLGSVITWGNGILSGDQPLVEAVMEAVRGKWPVSFDYWGPFVASIETEFVAYITIGSVLSQTLALVPTFSQIPANPDGYEPEGVRLINS